MTSISTDSTEFPLPSKSPSILWVRRISVFLVALLGIASFALSFEALTDLAVRTKALRPDTAWLLPILLDGGAIVFGLGAYASYELGASRDARWSYRLVIAVTLGSVVLNIAHAEKGVLASSIAALPPTVLFLAFESLLRGLRTGDSERDVPARRPRAKVSSKPGSKTATVLPDAEVEFRRARAVTLSKEGLSRSRIARELGVSPATCLAILESTERQHEILCSVGVRIWPTQGPQVRNAVAKGFPADLGRRRTDGNA